MNRHTRQPIRMKRTHDPHAKAVNSPDDSHRLGASLRHPSRPMATIAKIDAETNHLLPEESWFGAEFQSRAAPWEQKYSRADTHGTGAFTVWGLGKVDLPEEKRPYATDASRLDVHVFKEGKRQARARKKFDQLIRHGLVVGNRDRLRPLLAMPKVSSKEQERRRQTAQRLVGQYVYESSEDETTAPALRNDPQSKPKKGRLMRLKQALTRLEMSPEHSQAGQQVPLSSHGIGKGSADAKTAIGREDGSLPTPGFVDAMRNPSHPDFGMDFTAALRLALAKEDKARVLAVPDEFWDSGDEDSEQSTIVFTPKRTTGIRLGQAARVPLAKPSPQTRPLHRNRTEIGAQREFDIVEFTVARTSQMGGLDFRDARLVDIFNRIMQRDNPRRPIRSQASLLAISHTDPNEYFGQDLQIMLESDAYCAQVGRAIARLLPHSRLS